MRHLSILGFLFLSALCFAQPLQITKFEALDPADRVTGVIKPGKQYIISWNQFNDNDDFYDLIYSPDNDSPHDNPERFKLVYGKLGSLNDEFDLEDASYTDTILIPCNVVTDEIPVISGQNISTRSFFAYFKIRRHKGINANTKYGNTKTMRIVGGPQLVKPIVQLECENPNSSEVTMCFPTLRQYSPMVIDDGDHLNNVQTYSLNPITMREDRLFLWYESRSEALSTKAHYLGLGGTYVEPLHESGNGNTCFTYDYNDDDSNGKLFHVVIVDENCTRNGQYLVDLSAFAIIPNPQLKPNFLTNIILPDDSNAGGAACLTRPQYHPLTDVESEIFDLTQEPPIVVDGVPLTPTVKMKWFHVTHDLQNDTTILNNVDFYSSVNPNETLDFAKRKVCVSDIKAYNNPENYRDYELHVTRTLSYKISIDSETESESEPVVCTTILPITVSYFDPNDPGDLICEDIQVTENFTLNSGDASLPTETYQWSPSSYLSDSTALSPVFSYDEAVSNGATGKLRYSLTKTILITPPLGTPYFIDLPPKCFDLKLVTKNNGDGFATPGQNGGTVPSLDPEKIIFEAFPNPVDKVRNQVELLLTDLENQLPKSPLILTVFDGVRNVLSGEIIPGEVITLPTNNLNTGMHIFNVYHGSDIIATKRVYIQ